MPVCPAPGEGWSLVPAWPGKVKNLDHYEVEVLGTDGRSRTYNVQQVYDSASVVKALFLVGYLRYLSARGEAS